MNCQSEKIDPMRFAEASPEQSAQIATWANQDACFALLNGLRVASQQQNAQLVETIRILLSHHREKSGSCWDNVLIEAQRTDDPFKKRVYFNVALLSEHEFMKYQGGHSHIEQTAGRTHIRFTYPGCFESPVRGGELVLSPEENYLILDVSEEKLYQDPEDLLQYLDSLDAAHVQTFEKLGGSPVQWWSILTDEPSAVLKVRWARNVKVIAPDTALVGRYRKLLEKQSHPDGRIPGVKELECGDGPSLGDQASAMRDLALEYNGQSVFASYAKTRLEQRRKDRWRESRRDGFAHADVLIQEPPTMEASQGPFRGLQTETVWPPDPTGVEVVQTAVDLALRSKILASRLTKRELKVFELQIQGGLTRAKIARIVGVAPETVSRDRKKIRAKARRLRLVY